MSTDARVRYTKMVIQNSFIELLKKKPINKVTVKEICELSEINRATFYKYYCDAYDLLEKMEQEFLDELFQNVCPPAQHDFRNTLTLIMGSIKANAEVYQTIVSENGDRHFPSRIFALCYKNLAEYIEKKFPNFSPAQQKWVYYFIAHGLSGILDQWIVSGMAEPIGEVVDFADTLLQHTFEQ